MVLQRVSILGVCLAAAAASLAAQEPAAGPAFDVASIKPSPPFTPAMMASGTIHAGYKIDVGRVDIGQYPLINIVCKAYDVKGYQVTGPTWIKTERFDIVAKMPAGSTKEQVPQMLQALLAERFKMKMHRESKEESTYALVVAKGGLKIKESAPLPVAAPADPEAPAAPAGTGSNQVSIKQNAGGQGMTATDGEGRTQKMSMSPDGKSMHLEASRITLAELAEGLSGLVGRPVVDMTETTAKYDMALDLSMQDLMNAARAAGAAVPGGGEGGSAAEAASDPSGGGSIFNAIQALGLKLEPRKIALNRVVIDSVEKTPTEN